MSTQPQDEAELVPIDAAARQLGLRASAIRYYEQRGLIQPALRRSGKRWYGHQQLRQLAIIQFWQKAGMMNLDQIAEILTRPHDTERWTTAVKDQIAALDVRIHQLHTAREHLAHIVQHHPDSTPEGCPHYETQIWASQIA